MFKEVGKSEFGGPIHAREFTSELIADLGRYKDSYHPIRVPIISKTTDNNGLKRLLADRTWHSSTPLHVSPGSILVVTNDQKPATPGENAFYFEVTTSPTQLTQEQAHAEWRQWPFRTEGFARRHGYFPYVLPGLIHISREQLMKKYFQAPPQEVMDAWIHKARMLSPGANCYKRRFGAIIVESGKIVSAGNNYVYSGYQKHECEPCLRLNVASGTRVEACNAIHAEQAVVVNALNRHINLQFGILAVAGQEPDGSPFMNPNFYCTVCSRILNEVSGLVGVVTDTKEGAKFRFLHEIVNESFTHLASTLK